MNHNEALLQTIILLLQEYKTFKGFESLTVAKDILDLTKNKISKLSNGDYELMEKLLAVLQDLMLADSIDVDSYIESIEVALAEYPNLSKILEKQLTTEFNKNKQYYKREKLISFIKREKLYNKLSTTIHRIKKPGIDIKDVLMDLKNTVEELVDFKIRKNNETVLGEVDFDSDDSLDEAVKDAASLYNSGDVLKTGWSCINEMTMGGLRRGEFVTVAALPHNYKSGFTKSLFLQLCRLNKPKLDNPDKKPLMIFFSVEEDIKVVLGFFYSYFKFLKEGKHIPTDPSKLKLDAIEMRDYLKKHLKDDSNYHLKLIKLNPTTTTYKTIIDMIDDYSKQGYETHAVFIDYLSEISKEGCTIGPAGVEYKDLFKRMRTEMGKRKILCVTPHQISTQAKQLIRNGIPNLEFVKHLPGKGYYAHSGQLDQEIDLELFLHKAAIDRKPVLTVQRGKHRLPNSVVDESKLYTVLRFPRNAPIPEECEHFQPCMKLNDTDDEFDF